MVDERNSQFYLRDLISPVISKKTETFFREQNINVAIQNFPKTPSLILANHPTIQDSHIWRLEPNAIHAVHAQALQKTGVTPIDRLIALNYSRMIPVFDGDDRQKTYEDIVMMLQKGYSVVVNPTGKTSGTNSIPQSDEIKIGAIIRPWQLSSTKLNIIPAYVQVDTISSDNTIAPGSNVSVAVDTSPLEVDSIFKDQGEIDRELFANQLIERWHNLASTTGVEQPSQ